MLTLVHLRQDFSLKIASLTGEVLIACFFKGVLEYNSIDNSRRNPETDSTKASQVYSSNPRKVSNRKTPKACS